MVVYRAGGIVAGSGDGGETIQGGSPVEWLEQLPAAALVLSRDAEPLAWNAAAAALLGWTPGSRPFRFCNPAAPWFEGLVRAVGEHGQGRVTIRRRRGGQPLVLELRAGALGTDGLIVLLRDRTAERRRRRTAAEQVERSTEQLRHSEKMAAIGRLAAGIAHDFNNIVTAIQGHAEFLLHDLPEDLPAYGDVVEIRRAADRATELTRQLLTFARRQPSRPAALDLNEIIHDVEKLLRRLTRSDIVLATDLAPRLPQVYVDAGHIAQVLMNLVVNASEAIDESGTITIRTGTSILDRETAEDWRLPPGRYLCLSVRDTGAGMTEDVQRHAFEPFFTTKPTGTGLGLSTVYGIVKQAGGEIMVESRLGSGSTFTVLLPGMGM
jgi:signal transduction histidine kinase